MAPTRAIAFLVCTLVATCWLASSCSDGSAADQDGGPDGGAGGSGELVVSAASSLTDVFGELADQFEQQHPGVDVVLNLDSSSTLATQAVRGAPVDVFASADRLNIEEVEDAGLLAGEPSELAINSLVLVTNAGRSGAAVDLAGLERVAEQGGVVALCARTAPCGRLAERVLDSAGITLPEDRVTRAPNARSTLGAVTRGDAAAALVYATDAQAAGDAVTVVSLPSSAAASTRYYVAALEGGLGDAALAAAFVQHVASPGSSELLAAEGFG